jgi:ankyrin repeat protein
MGKSDMEFAKHSTYLANAPSVSLPTITVNFINQEIVKLLLDQGADVNAHSGYYDNALYAASTGHQEIVKLLLDKGVDVNAQGGEYHNALQAASSAGHQETVKLLLDKGADVNAHGGEYSIALEAASLEGHQGIVNLLQRRGAKTLPSKRSRSRTPSNPAKKRRLMDSELFDQSR